MEKCINAIGFLIILIVTDSVNNKYCSIKDYYNQLTAALIFVGCSSSSSEWKLATDNVGSNIIGREEIYLRVYIYISLGKIVFKNDWKP